jgi:hypothetical protein
VINLQRIKKVAMFALLTATVLADVGCRKDHFPASGAVAGWQKGDKTQTFDAATLWQYIDGGADQFVKAGVVTASTSDYKFQGSLEAVVDIYTMKTAAGVKTIFDADPAAGSQNVQLGDAARLYQQSLVFRKGPYLVRITAYEAGAPGEADALLALAHGVESRI